MRHIEDFSFKGFFGLRILVSDFNEASRFMELRLSQGSNTALRVQFFFLILQSLFHRLQVYSVILQCVVLNSLGAVTLQVCIQTVTLQVHI